MRGLCTPRLFRARLRTATVVCQLSRGAKSARPPAAEWYGFCRLPVLLHFVNGGWEGMPGWLFVAFSLVPSQSPCGILLACAPPTDFTRLDVAVHVFAEMQEELLDRTSSARRETSIFAIELKPKRCDRSSTAWSRTTYNRRTLPPPSPTRSHEPNEAYIEGVREPLGARIADADVGDLDSHVPF